MHSLLAYWRKLLLGSPTDVLFRAYPLGSSTPEGGGWVGMIDANSEVPFEFGNDDAFDVPSDVSEGAENVFPGRWSSVQEGYVAGEVEIHFHFRLVEPKLADYCLVFENAAHVDFGGAQQTCVKDKGATGASLSPTLGHGAVRPADYTQTLVPVYPSKFVEEEKVVVPSLVRLQLLDSCPHAGSGNFGNLMGPAPSGIGSAFLRPFPESLAGTVDGKTSGAQRLAPFVLPGQSPSEVFEDGAHVLKGVSDDDAEKQRRLLENLCPEDVLTAVSVGLVDDSIRITGVKGRKFVAENFQVAVCPKQLQTGTSEGIGHEP